MARSATSEQLQALHQASERISANLVELELDSGRQLLEASVLRGRTAERWSEASAALTELWRRHGLLQDLLGRADVARGVDRRALLEGQSIELGSADIPLTNRSLLQSPERTERCTPDQLLRSMSDAFDEVKGVVSAISRAWERLTPRIEEARRLLRDATDLSEEVGDGGRTELEAAAAALTRLGAGVTNDPLAVAESDVDELLREVRHIHAEAQATASLKRDFEARMREAHQLLEQVRTTIRRSQVAREELRAKIAAATVPAPPGSPDELERALVRISDVVRAGAWRPARTALTDWTDQAHALLDDAERSLAASRAPIEARNQFRALLDAYQVKAARLGLVEDPELADLFGRTYDVLYSAPTDLAAAAQLVRGYQQAVSGWPDTREAHR